MLSRFSVKRPYTVVVGIILVVILGIVSITKMPADLLPNMNLPYAVVITTYPGASPEEVEMVVSSPVESSMATISNIKNISSISSENVSIVILEFEQTANMDSATIEMRENLDQISTFWIDDISNPIIMKLNPDMLPVMIAAVDKEGLPRRDLSDYVTDTVVPELESLEGVALVEAIGGIEESIHVIIEQDRIDAINVDVKKAIEQQFAEAEEEIKNARLELEQGKEELESGKEDMASQLSEAERQLSDNQLDAVKGEIEINRQLEELEIKEAEVLEGEEELEKQEAELAKAETDLKQGEEQLQVAKTQLTEAKEGVSQLLLAKGDLEESKVALEDQLREIDTLGENAPDELKVMLPELNQQLALVEEQLDQVKSQLSDIGMSIEEIDEKLIEVDNKLLELNDSKEELITGKKLLASSRLELEAGKAQLAQGRSILESTRDDIASGKLTMSQALEELSKSEVLGSIEISTASEQIASGERELQKAEAELEEAKNSALDKASLGNIITSDMVKGILGAQNFNMPAGYVTEDGIDYLIRVGDKIADKDALEELILVDMNIEGIDPIRLSDVAQVVTIDNSEDVYSVVNGNPGIVLTMQKQTGYSTGEVSDRINDKMEELMGQDSSLNFLPLMDQGIYIDMTISSVTENMISGALLAILILLIFLKDIKPTLVVALSIPVSVIAAIALMYFSGVTINVISLSGLAVAIGMLVDNSIVVMENIYRLRKEGLPAREAAVEGAKEVTGAIIASTLTTVCVFLPIVFTEGITRQLFVDMGLTIAYTLLASLVIALTFVPMMSAGLLKNTVDKRNKLFDRIKNAYGKLLKKTLKHKWVVIIGSIALLIISAVWSLSKGTSFLPNMESTQATITLVTDEESTLQETARISDEVMERILEIEDVETIGAMADGGSMLSMGGSDRNNSVIMYLVLREDKDLTGVELEKLILDKTSDIDAELSINTQAMDMSALGGGGVQVIIKGRDLDILQEIAVDVTDIVAGVDGTIEISDGQEDAAEELRIIVDKDKASEHNLTVAQVFQEVNSKVRASSSATSINIDNHDYDVFVKNKEDEELTRKDLEKLTITTKDASGNNVETPLSDIADFIVGTSPSSIFRDGQERYMTVSAGVDSDHNVGLVGNEIERQLDNYQLPEGYSVELAGENEIIDESLEQLTLMLLLAVAFIYLIMVAQFQSLLSPFIIMFTIPLVFTGGFLGLIISNNEMTIISMIGFIVLSGVIVNNGIVLVDYINQMRRKGMSKKEAILEAGVTRLRPILMTTLTTVLGLATLAAGIGMGADLVQPLAIVVVGGLLYGTLMTLFLVPSLYDIFNKEKSLVEDEI